MKEEIPIFIINLKKDFQKKNYMQQTCNNLNLQCEFVEAVNGKLLSKDFLSKVYSKEKSENAIGRGLTPGEIGTAMSHKKVYEHILQDGIEKAIIFEDDIDINENIHELLINIDKLPLDWECVLLGHHPARSRFVDTVSSCWLMKKISENYSAVRFVEYPFGAYAYLINKQGVKKLLNELNTIIEPIDHYTGRSTLINVYGIKPSCVKVHKELLKNSSLEKDRKVITGVSNKESKVKVFLKKSSALIEVVRFIKSLPSLLKAIIKKMFPINTYKLKNKEN